MRSPRDPHLSKDPPLYRWTARERAFLAKKLNTPPRVQAFLDTLPYRCDGRYPPAVCTVRERTAHCFDGALLAAAALRRSGVECGLVNLRAQHDDDHLLCVYRSAGRFGAVAKSNFPGLRYREPIFRSLRELVMSYFEFYFNLRRQKTLRAFSLPFWLATPPFSWEETEEGVEQLAAILDSRRYYQLLSPKVTSLLQLVDDRLYRSQLLGVRIKGVTKWHK